MRRSLHALPAIALVAALASAAQTPNAPGATFKIDDSALSSSPVFIIYGDTRFTRWQFARNASSPWARQALVQKIASEKPDAVFITGDIPFQGAQMSDYQVFQQETEIWTRARLRLFPALGNHEFYDRNFFPHQQKALENWWSVFPSLRDRRWYSVQLGKQIYALCLDSNFAGLKQGGPQRLWIDRQLSNLPESVNYVFFVLHHARMGDHLEGHSRNRNRNPQTTAPDFDSYLERKQSQFRARFVVVSGHVHNYGRFERNGVVYIISGGGGAHPVFFRRQEDDEFNGKDLVADGQPLPNYHYVKFEIRSSTLKATMIRISNPKAGQGKASWDSPDKFVIAQQK